MKKLTAEKCAWLVRQLKSAEVMSGELSIADQYKLQALEIALPILEQQERGEGEWIDWKGGECPLEDYTIVDIKHRDGRVVEGEMAGNYIWTHGYYHYLTKTGADIIAYRITQGQQEIKDSIEGEEWIYVDGTVKNIPEGNDLLMVRYENGSTAKGKAKRLYWGIDCESRIIAFRIIPEQPTNQNGEQ